MKKLLTIALLLLAGLTASAQNGKWTAGVGEKDELRGQPGGRYFRYEVEGDGSFEIYDWNDWVFKITTAKGAFDVLHYRNGGERYMRVTIALYSLDNNLQVRVDTELEADASFRAGWINRQGLYYPSVKKKLRKMIGALKSGTGYVRVLCERNNTPALDLKVMPYKDAMWENNK